MIPLGEVARKCREQKGMSQRAAAKELGITDVHLCNIEAGRSEPSLRLLGLFAYVYGMDVYVAAWALNSKSADVPAGIVQSLRDLDFECRKYLAGERE